MEQLIPGLIYFLNSCSGWVFKFDRYTSDDDLVIVRASHQIYPKDSEYLQQVNLTSSLPEISLATAEQRAHLEACIDAGKYVEPPKPLSYDIF